MKKRKAALMAFALKWKKSNRIDTMSITRSIENLKNHKRCCKIIRIIINEVEEMPDALSRLSK